MQIKNILITIALYFIVVSCNENVDEPIDQNLETATIKKELITGCVQKGPFINGTSIVFSELDSNLVQTGRTFSSQITNKEGSFELRGIELQSPFVEIKADGFYFNEVTGDISSERISLFALADLSEQNAVNVNVLTTIERNRIFNLIAEGNEFSEAKKQAQSEVLALFNIQKSDIKNSENMNIMSEGDDNAILLAASVILQGYRTVAELSELITNISFDLGFDGELDNTQLGSALINDVKKMNLDNIINHIDEKYSETGHLVAIPDFKKYITNFISTTNYSYTLKIEYPETGKFGANILAISEGAMIASPTEYSLRALIPENYYCKIIVKGTAPYKEGAVFYGSYIVGEVSTWELESKGLNNQQWIAKSEARDAIAKISFEGQSQGVIEYYETELPTPTRVTNFSWGLPANIGIVYPESGLYGRNILAMENNSILNNGEEYSLALEVPSDINLFLFLSLTVNSETGSLYYDESKNISWSISTKNTRRRINLSCKEFEKKTDGLIVFENQGSALIEIKAMGSDKPIVSKTISWQ